MAELLRGYDGMKLWADRADTAEYDSEGNRIADSLAAKQGKPSSSTEGDIATFDSGSSTIDSGKAFLNSTGTWDGNSDSLVPTAKSIQSKLDEKLQGIKLAGTQSPIAPDASKIVTIPLFSNNVPGLVPSATASDADKALRGDGTWGDVSSVSVSYDSVNEQIHLDFSPQVNNGGN